MRDDAPGPLVAGDRSDRPRASNQNSLSQLGLRPPYRARVCATVDRVSDCRLRKGAAGRHQLCPNRAAHSARKVRAVTEESLGNRQPSKYAATGTAIEVSVIGPQRSC